MAQRRTPGATLRVRADLQLDVSSSEGAEAGLGITLVTPLMLSTRFTGAPIVPLPGPSTRDVVVLARTSALERAGVVRVRSALVQAFGSAEEFSGDL